MPFDETHLDDPEELTAAIDDLLAGKPHLRPGHLPVTLGKDRYGRQLPSTSLPY